MNCYPIYKIRSTIHFIHDILNVKIVSKFRDRLKLDVCIRSAGQIKKIIKLIAN